MLCCVYLFSLFFFFSTVAFSSWDFAGQELYYYTHLFFLSTRGIYLLCFNLLKPGMCCFSCFSCLFVSYITQHTQRKNTVELSIGYKAFKLGISFSFFNYCVCVFLNSCSFPARMELQWFWLALISTRKHALKNIWTTSMLLYCRYVCVCVCVSGVCVCERERSERKRNNSPFFSNRNLVIGLVTFGSFLLWVVPQAKVNQRSCSATSMTQNIPNISSHIPLSRFLFQASMISERS